MALKNISILFLHKMRHLAKSYVFSHEVFAFIYKYKYIDIYIYKYIDEERYSNIFKIIDER